MNLEQERVKNDEVIRNLTQLACTRMICDLDDTFLSTWKHFQFYEDKYLRYIQKLVKEPLAELKKHYYVLDYEALGYLYVNQKRVEWMAQTIGKAYGLSNSEITNGLNILKSIYVNTPEIKPGALDLLETVKSIPNFQIDIVTHGNTTWTYQKLIESGLFKYVDGIFIANENRQKSFFDWHRALYSSDNISNIVGVGDNINSDIIPMATLGILPILVESEWPFSTKGTLPNQAVKIGSLGQFGEGLSQLIKKQATN